MSKSDLDGPELNKRMRFLDEDGNPIPGHRSLDGTWFGPIKKFPAVLWDGPYYGFIRFETEDELKKYREYGLNIHPSGEITAPKEKGISTMPRYEFLRIDDFDKKDDLARAIASIVL